MKRIEWSLYQPEDWAWVLAMHVTQEATLGRQMDLPDLNERPIISAYVGRRNGKIVACVFGEAELEVCALGSAPLSKKDIQDVSARMIRDAQFYYLRIARAFVPVQALRGKKRPPVKRILTAAGFTEVDETMVDFYRWIPKKRKG
jgi:hypothetical protein